MPIMDMPYAGGPEDPADRARLAGLLQSLGATDAELADSRQARSGGDLALELVLRTGPPVPFEEAAARIGSDPDEFALVWRALGFPSPTGPGSTVPADVMESLPVVTQATRDWLGEETALGIARVVGSATARLAESLVDAFRMQFEVPQLTAGRSYTEVVEEYVTITREALPAFEAFVAAVLKAHLVRVASGTWTPDADRAATRRDLFVGFVDLVGYTALSRTLSPAELTRLLGQFENTISDVVTGGGGRLVKLIGDGAMFVVDTAEGGCAVALELNTRLTAAESLPPARIGADCGPLLSLYGDYFGEVVNRAARLVALAHPSTVVVSEQVEGLCRTSFAFEQLPPQALKGFHAPAVSYRLLGR
jgi:class 3 adenylate cyclase